MISANELRVGNVLWYLDRYCIVEGIGDFGIFEQINVSGIKCRELKTGYEIDDLCEANFYPIPLTEDILLKCGFVWNNDYEIFTIETKLTKDISITYSDNKYFKLLDIDYTVTFKHLHQLQNLYFALTGEELNVEL